jgi:UDP-3-O-acyl N-acetylglucosamine deacetylase
VNVRSLGYRYQRTIGRPAVVEGIGYLTGARVRLRFRPAAAHTGLVFVRTDLRHAPAVRACVANVTGVNRRTTLGRPPGQVELVEHVLAALAGLRIDNCVIEVSAPEPPGLDGSAHAFVQALAKAGVVLQDARREAFGTDRAIMVAEGRATLTWHPMPRDRLRVSYLLDYGDGAPIPGQRHTHDVTPEHFCHGLEDSRTFLLLEEAEHLRRQGWGAHATPADLLVFGPRGLIGNRLRYADEPARHKLLDLIGDLALFGHDLRGHVVAYRSGHSLNAALVRRLAQELETEGRPQEWKLAA